MSDQLECGNVDKQALQQRVRQIERQLNAVERERDDLERDVEQLCIARGGHMFSSSYVLSERLKFLEAEVKQQRVQLRTITAERDSLQEDIQTIKASKRQADQGWQAERQNASALEQQVSFFQTSSAKAFADRDSAVYEVQSLKSQLTAASSALRESQALLTTLQQQCREQQQQISNTQQQLESTRNELTQCRGQLKMMATLQQQLEQQREAAKQLQAELDHSQAEHRSALAAAAAAQSDLRDAQSAAADLRGQLAEAHERSRQAAVQHREDKAALQKKLSERSVALDDAERLLEQTSAALVVSQAVHKERHAERKHRRTASAGHAGVSAPKSTGADSPQSDEMQRLQAAVADAEDSLQRAARDQVDVLNELAHLQAMHDEHESVIQQLTDTNNELKSKLAQATQDKVHALLQLAQQEQSSAASSAQPVGISLLQQRQQKQQQKQWKHLGLGFMNSSDGAAMQHSPGTCSTPPPSPATGAFMHPAVLQKKATSSTDNTVKAPPTPDHATAAAVAAANGQPADIVVNTAGGGSGGSTSLQTKSNLTGAVASSALATSQQQQVDATSWTSGSPVAAAATAGMTSSASKRARDLPTQQASPATVPTLQPEVEHQLMQQLQQHVHHLELLLLYAHHYRSSLETLQPGANGAAAAGDSSSRSSAAQDPVTRLSNIGQEMETCRKLFGRSRGSMTAQQHDLLVRSLLQGSSSSSSSTSINSPAGRLAEILDMSHSSSSSSSSSSSTSSYAIKQDSAPQHTGLVGALGKLLTGGGHKSSSAVTSTKLQNKHGGSIGSSAGSEPNPARAVGNSSLALDEVCMSQLEASIAWEVQLLADLCVAALRHIHKVTALNNLMQDTW